jgi:hypothetical protein
MPAANLNLALASLGTSVTAPAFADTSTGALAATQVAPIVGVLIELRAATNLALTNSTPDIEQMRADELFQLTSPGATI